jgi:hypothetical protein
VRINHFRDKFATTFVAISETPRSIARAPKKL